MGCSIISRRGCRGGGCKRGGHAQRSCSCRRRRLCSSRMRDYGRRSRRLCSSFYHSLQLPCNTIPGSSPSNLGGHKEPRCCSSLQGGGSGQALCKPEADPSSSSSPHTCSGSSATASIQEARLTELSCTSSRHGSGWNCKHRLVTQARKLASRREERRRRRRRRRGGGRAGNAVEGRRGSERVAIRARGGRSRCGGTRCKGSWCSSGRGRHSLCGRCSPAECGCHRRTRRFSCCIEREQGR